MTLLAAFSIVLVAATVQAVTGFGFALVAVPLLTLATDPRTAVVADGLAALVLTGTAMARERGHVQWRPAALLFGSALVGMPAGLAILRYAPERALAALIAVVVLGSTLVVWRGLRVAGRPAAVTAIGALSGALSTSTGMNGPPLVAAFQAMGYDPRTFRATLAAVFTGSGVCAVAGFVLAGQVTAHSVSVGVAGAPGVLLGWWVGNRVFERIHRDRFRGIVLAALIVSSAVVLCRVLFF